MRKENTVSAVTGIAFLVLGLIGMAAPAGAAGASSPAASTSQAAAVYGHAMIGGNLAAVNVVNNLSDQHIGIPIYAADRIPFQMSRSPQNPYGAAPVSTAQSPAVYGTSTNGGNLEAINLVNGLLAMHIGIPIYAAHRAAFQMSRSPENPYGFHPLGLNPQ